MEGRTDALFGPSERLRMFAVTSGTTRRAKHIPITDRFVRLFREGWWVWGGYVRTDRPSAYRDMVLQVTGAACEHRTSAGLPCGSVSGLITDMLPQFVKRMYVRPPETAHVKDGATKYYVTMRFAASASVSLISTANPSTILAIARVGETHHEELIRDVRDGTVTFFEEPDAEVAEALRRRVSPDPEGARRLEAVRRRTGKLLPRDIWPHLSMLACWKGGTLVNYLTRFEEYFGNAAVHEIGLVASEGRMSVPLSLLSDAAALDVTSNFYEFIPAEDADAEAPDALLAHELEEGRQYSIVLTNAGGLYRYKINDLVRVAGFYRRAPLIEFMNKGSGFSSITGEKLSEHQAVLAMRQACGGTRNVVDTFTLSAAWDHPPFYHVVLEEGVLADGEGTQLLDRLDTALCALNVEYESKRHTGRLGPLRLVKLPAGAWDRRRDRKIRQNQGRIEQYKHVYVVQDFEFVDGLMEAVGAVPQTI